MKKILITGSASFIMSNFVRYLQFKYSDSYQISSIDKLTKSSTMMNNVLSNKKHSFHIGDICDAQFINNIFEIEKPEIVIHAAAETFVDKSLDQSVLFQKTNVIGTQEIINACVKHKVEKLIHISTDEVYGQFDKNQDGEWFENEPLNPRNPYAASKAAAELLVKSGQITWGLPYIIIRPSNNWGHRQSKEKLIPKIIKSILDGTQIPIYGAGEQIREWTYVNDTVNAIRVLLESDILNQTFNVSSNIKFSNIEIVNKITDIMGGKNLITFVPDPRGNAHDFKYSINCDKIKKIGWESQFDFDAELPGVIDWYVKNRWILN